MKKYESLVKKYAQFYSRSLDELIKDAKSRTELLEQRRDLQAYTKRLFVQQFAKLSENERKKSSSMRTAEKYLTSYSEALERIIDEERRDKNELNRRRAELKKVTEESFKSEVKRDKAKKLKQTAISAAAATLVASSLLAGYAVAKGNGDKLDDKQPAVSDTMPQEEDNAEDKILEAVGEYPEIRSYENEHGEFLRLDNIVDINVWGYNEVLKELQEYQQNNPDGKYGFDMTMLSPEVGCGTHIAESSGKINCNKDNPEYQGPYSVGIDDEYIESINVVSRALTGEDCIDPNNVANDVQDPRIAVKAFWYNVIDNYRLLETELETQGLKGKVEITDRLLLDAYLNGARGSVRKILNGKDDKRPYADKILEYSEVFEDYAECLAEHPEIREMDSSTYGKNAHIRLNKITDKYSDESRSSSESQELE